MNFTQLSQLYLESPDFENLADNSKLSYRSQINKLSRILEGIDFTECMQNRVAYMPSDVALRVSSDVYKALTTIESDYCKLFARRVLLVIFTWAEKKRLMTPGFKLDVPNFKYTKPDTVAFSKDIMENLKRKSVVPWARPYRNMALFCFYSGMRPNEAENLKPEDVVGDYIHIKHAKGHLVGQTARMCKVTPQMRELMTDGSEYIFHDRYGKKLNARARSRAMESIREDFGIVGTFYSTRRGAATEMRKAGYDIRTISKQLGHKNIATTEIYLRLSMEEEASNFNGF